jgi:hypothetical protein
MDLTEIPAGHMARHPWKRVPGSAMSVRVICFVLGACGNALPRRSLRWTPGMPRPPRSTESAYVSSQDVRLKHLRRHRGVG